MTKQCGPFNKSSKKLAAKTSQGKSWLETLNMSTPRVSILNAIVNPTPLLKLTQVTAQKYHLEVLIGQMNLIITSPILAGRPGKFQFKTNGSCKP